MVKAKIDIQPEQASLPASETDEPTVERMQRNAEAIRVLDSFLEGDPQEQRETWEFLKQALDEDRLPGQKHFS